MTTTAKNSNNNSILGKHSSKVSIIRLQMNLKKENHSPIWWQFSRLAFPILRCRFKIQDPL